MQIYNSMSRKKETFVPIHEGKVGIYACGPTVYNFFHIGNARPFIVFDVLRRYFEYRGYEVTFVQNFTDIDDKMIRRANEEGVTVGEIAERYIAEYFTDAKALGIRPATVHPRATEHIPQIIALIQRLIDKGLAYESRGDVYYRVRAFPSYGCLCGQNLEDLESGAHGMYRIHSFQIFSGNRMTATATVSLQRGADVITRADCGDGPVEACFHAVDQITGFKCKLESYQLRAVTEGEDALGEVTVRVSNENVTMLGKGVSTDIIEASCLAYLNAVNRVIEARSERETGV